MSEGPAGDVEVARERSGAARRHPVLDGLRGVAIAAVVWHHCLPRAVSGWLGRGHAGVPLFFALSGYLITRLLLAERAATGDIALGPFWIRRCLRIFPLYYVTLVGFVSWLALGEPSAASDHFFDSLPFYASYTSNWFVDFDVAHPVWFGFAWSLATEEQFYLWWPSFLRAAERIGRALAPLGLVALLGLDLLAESGFFGAWFPAGSTSARVLTSPSAAMLLGALLAWARARPGGFSPLLRRALGARYAVALAAAAAAGWIWQPLGHPLLLELSFAMLVGAAAESSGRGLVERALAAEPLVYVGRVSYGIYLLHVPVLGGVKRSWPALTEQPLALFLLSFPLSLGLAGLSHRHLEAPLSAFGRRFRPGQPDAPAALGWVRER